jgi:hypothetical protein
MFLFCCKLFNFVIQIFLLFIPEISSGFMSYIRLSLSILPGSFDPIIGYASSVHNNADSLSLTDILIFYLIVSQALLMSSAASKTANLLEI